jgi:probable rRNA maturation factor
MPVAVRVQLGAALGQRYAVRRRRTAGESGVQSSGNAAAAGTAHRAGEPGESPRIDTIPDASVRRLMARAARATLREAGERDAEVSITLLDDTEIAEMNGQFLKQEGTTDVIAFALYDEGEDVVGDVYVGFDQALRQAGADRVDALEELARLAVHGTLHVLGHDHPEGSDRLDSEMWRLQESIVAAVVAG